jgi:hypothetical protein
MTSKSRPTYGDEVLHRASGVSNDPSGHSEPSDSGDGAPPRHERRRRSAPAANRALSDVSRTAPVPAGAPVNFDPSSSREALIATTAYYRAESRGFLPGYEMEDWLAAERAIDGAGTDPL